MINETDDYLFAETFYPGEIFVYTNGESWQLGVVKSKRDDSVYFCYYHTGDTASATPVFNMHKLENAYYPPLRFAKTYLSDIEG